MHAVIRVGSSQYSVTPGQRLLVAKPQIDGVLMVVDGAKTLVGNPIVANATVKIKALGQVKGKKVRAATYKSKSRERKVRGFRAQYTEILIEDIYLGEKKVQETKEEPKTEAKKVVKKTVKAKS